MDWFPYLHWWAVLAAGITGFVIGGVWYAPPIFGNRWLRLLGTDPAIMRRSTAPILLALVAALATACLLAFLIAWSGAAGPLEGAWVGFVAWAAFCIAIELPRENLERRLAVFLIGSGHKLLLAVAMGAILGAWR